MAYWSSRDVAGGNFVDYDPTPYSGGYDLAFTYGRPLPPSDDICYPVSAAASTDFQRHQYSSGSQNSTFEIEDTIKNDLYGRQRPEPQPDYGFYPHAQPDYGNLSYGHEGITATGVHGPTDYVLGYGGRPQFQQYGSSYGQGYGHQEYGSEDGLGYQGDKNSHHRFDGRPELSFGYGRDETKHQGVGEFGDGGYMRNEHYPYTRTSYGDEYCNTEYTKPTFYNREKPEGYAHSKHINDSYDEDNDKHEYQKNQHHCHHNY